MKDYFIIGAMMGMIAGACLVSCNKDAEKVVKKGKKAIADAMSKD